MSKVNESGAAPRSPAHTAGPWRLATPDELEEVSEYRPHVVAPGPLYVAAVYDSVDEHAANARLIAAAPQLYEVVKLAIGYDEQGGGPPSIEAERELFRLARAALAAAEDRPSSLGPAPEDSK